MLNAVKFWITIAANFIPLSKKKKKKLQTCQKNSEIIDLTLIVLFRLMVYSYKTNWKKSFFKVMKHKEKKQIKVQKNAPSTFSYIPLPTPIAWNSVVQRFFLFDLYKLTIFFRFFLLQLNTCYPQAHHHRWNLENMLLMISLKTFSHCFTNYLSGCITYVYVFPFHPAEIIEYKLSSTIYYVPKHMMAGLYIWG